jgi:hypothetical protein
MSFARHSPGKSTRRRVGIQASQAVIFSCKLPEPSYINNAVAYLSLARHSTDMSMRMRVCIQSSQAAIFSCKLCQSPAT